MKVLKMNSLIIGDTSQLSYYFPIEYKRISSRNINFKFYTTEYYDRIYICFAEQRTFIENNKQIFLDINVDYTLKIISFFRHICNKLIIYSTSELWNNYNGSININMEYNYNYSDYIDSKRILCEKLKELNYNNVIIIYPFNFNTPYRKQGFLFSKIFNSIINKTKIEIGDTYFYRDIIHPSLIIEKSILVNNHEIIGSGRLIFINDFIRDLYKTNNLNYDEYVIENYNNNLKNKRNMYYLDSKTINITYEKIIEYTNNDINKFKQNIFS
jgi:nucleoside-diphosphate-sugar epimerase